MTSTKAKDEPLHVKVNPIEDQICQVKSNTDTVESKTDLSEDYFTPMTSPVEDVRDHHPENKSDRRKRSASQHGDVIRLILTNSQQKSRFQSNKERIEDRYGSIICQQRMSNPNSSLCILAVQEGNVLEAVASILEAILVSDCTQKQSCFILMDCANFLLKELKLPSGTIASLFSPDQLAFDLYNEVLPFQRILQIDGSKENVIKVARNACLIVLR